MRPKSNLGQQFNFGPVLILTCQRQWFLIKKNYDLHLG
jgi:hypothetical protein